MGSKKTTSKIKTENIRASDISKFSGQVAAVKNITQAHMHIQTLSSSDKKELLDSLLKFQKEIIKSCLPANKLSTINGDINDAIKEAKKEQPDISKIKSLFEHGLNTIGDDAQLANVDLQNVLQKQQQTLQMISNISKESVSE